LRLSQLLTQLRELLPMLGAPLGCRPRAQHVFTLELALTGPALLFLATMRLGLQLLFAQCPFLPPALLFHGPVFVTLAWALALPSFRRPFVLPARRFNQRSLFRCPEAPARSKGGAVSASRLPRKHTGNAGFGPRLDRGHWRRILATRSQPVSALAAAGLGE
jgi:hypothetical protein